MQNIHPKPGSEKPSQPTVKNEGSSQPVNATRLEADKAAVKAETPASPDGTDPIAAQWKRVETEARSKWPKLTDADFVAVGRNLDKLAERIQELYGDSRVTASAQLNEIVDKIKEDGFQSKDGGAKPKADTVKAKDSPHKASEAKAHI